MLLLQRNKESQKKSMCLYTNKKTLRVRSDLKNY